MKFGKSVQHSLLMQLYNPGSNPGSYKYTFFLLLLRPFMIIYKHVHNLKIDMLKPRPVVKLNKLIKKKECQTRESNSDRKDHSLEY